MILVFDDTIQTNDCRVVQFAVVITKIFDRRYIDATIVELWAMPMLEWVFGVDPMEGLFPKVEELPS